MPSVGEIFQGRYKLVEVLGRGGFAVVLRALDLTVDRQVAVKILTPDEDGYRPSVTSRFLREARILASLRDPHTITMYDFGRTSDGLFFMVFEYVAGVDLARILKMRGPFDEPTARAILTQLLGALREAHAAGILHRDLKPANVLHYEYMGDPNQVKLIDFGIAKPVDPAQDLESITRAGTMVGTPRYMSPEQICGEELGASSDIYSLGLIIAELVTGRPPVTGAETREIVRQQLDDSPLRLAADAPITEEFRRIVERMMAKDPAARYPTVDAVLDDLERAPRARPETRQPPDPVASRAERTLVEAQYVPPPEDTPASSTLTTVIVGLLAGAALVGGMFALIGGDDAPSEQPVTQRVEPAAKAPQPATVDEPPPPDTEPVVTVLEPDFGRENEPESGCGSERPDYVEREFMAWIDGARRSFIVTVPDSYDPDQPHPLLLLFHRSYHDVMAEGGSGFRNVANDNGLVVVAPKAADITGMWWRDGDLELVQYAIEEVQANLCIDPGLLYAVGHGSGGRMVENLACHMPLSGVVNTGFRARVGELMCPPPPVPYLHIMGANDPHYPLDGGRTCTAYPVISHDDHVARWRERNECKAGSERYGSHRDGDCEVWSCEEPLVACVVKGGHEWDGEPPGFLPTCRSRPTKFPYAREIWRFLSEHGRRLR